MFKHFIITRFNIPLTDNVEFNEKWFIDRMKLFKRFCLPSIVNQTNKNFTWIIFFSKNTPLKYIKKINQLNRKHIFETAFELDFSRETIRKNIDKFVNTDIKYLITSRLDNDDAVDIHFVDWIQKNFEKKDKLFIDFVKGYVINKHFLYLLNYKRNPFVTLIEKYKKDEYYTAYCHYHENIDEIAEVKEINFRAWAMVVHAENIANKVHGIKTYQKGFHKNFTIKYYLKLGFFFKLYYFMVYKLFKK